MLKQILNLQGVEKLSKSEQNEISGGRRPLPDDGGCNTSGGNTGQSCSTHADCTGLGHPVCHRGCCNVWV